MCNITGRKIVIHMTYTYSFKSVRWIHVFHMLDCHEVLPIAPTIVSDLFALQLTCTIFRSWRRSCCRTTCVLGCTKASLQLELDEGLALLATTDWPELDTWDTQASGEEGQSRWCVGTISGAGGRGWWCLVCEQALLRQPFLLVVGQSSDTEQW